MAAKSQLYVDSVEQFYVVYRKTPIDSAGLLVDHVNQ
jgi:hypothetical protein